MWYDKLIFYDRRTGGDANVTDIHCHILPAIDDGAEALDEALEMVRMAWESGVQQIIATPHCNLPGLENHRSQQLFDRLAALQEAVDKAGIGVTLLPGAEVMATPQLDELLRQNRLQTLADSRYLLIEFYFDEDGEVMEHLLQTVADTGLIPVIAHPERYEAVQRQPLTVTHWFRSGYIIQVNKGSLLGRLGRRAKIAADWILDQGLAHVVASDGHSAVFRTPHMTGIREYLTDHYGSRYTDILLHINPGRIAQDLPVLQADEL